MATPLTPAVNLYAQQMELEAEMTALGITRYDRINDKRVDQGKEDETDYGQTLMRGVLKEVAAAIAAFIEASGAGKPGRKSGAYRYVKDVEPEVLAFLTLKSILSSLTLAPKLVQVTTRIGGMVEDELRYRALREQDKGLYRWLRAEVRTKGTYNVARRTASVISNRENLDWRPWKQPEHHKVGSKLLDIVIEVTGLVQIEDIIDTTRRTLGKARPKQKIVTPTPATMEWIDDRKTASGLLSPMYEPMIVPPVDWEGPKGGGYLSTFVRPVKLVKTRSRAYLEALKSAPLDPVYAAVNAAQQTAWRINNPILEVIAFLWENGSTHGGIPGRYDEEMPPKPWDMDENPEARRAWRIEAAKVHGRNRETMSKRIQFVYTVETAQKYSRFAELYMPHQLDFRGRLYAVPQLNPQGPDYMKALLQFADAKPLGEDGKDWLAVQLANSGGFQKVDKAPLYERVQWVVGHQDKIAAVAADPFSDLWWTEADSPFQFLAACFEWASLMEHEGRGEQADTFLSSLPVALDGSCSGLQHFSLAFRDEVGGAAVNLLPSERPSDIYQLVANEVEARCVHLRDHGDDEQADLATQWLTFGINRSLTKRPTMTFGYGSRMYGFRDQVMTDTLAPAAQAAHRGEGIFPFDGDGFAASVFMARLIHEAVGRVVIKAAEAMDWLKGVANVVSAEQLPVYWVTPDGFPVLQAYRELKSRRVETFLAGSVVQISVAEETDKVDVRAQAQGISPNYIHSLDGCHLRMTVVRAVEEGMTNFALVHDSFGVHAGDTGRFFMVIREVLTEMYQKDVIADFIREIERQLSDDRKEELPAPPSPGNLDLEALVESDYCFA